MLSDCKVETFSNIIMQNEKSIIMKAFNKQFFDFLEDIIQIFPENNEIQVSKGYFNTIKKANPTSIIKVWYEFVYKPYSDAIDKGDMTFFLTKDYSNDVYVNKEYVLKVIDESLRKPLLSMDETNKQHCAKYAKVLSDLCKRYMED